MTITVNLKTGVTYKIENVTDFGHYYENSNLIFVYHDRFETVRGINGPELERFNDQVTLYKDEFTSLIVEN